MHNFPLIFVFLNWFPKRLNALHDSSGICFELMEHLMRFRDEFASKFADFSATPNFFLVLVSFEYDNLKCKFISILDSSRMFPWMRFLIFVEREIGLHYGKARRRSFRTSEMSMKAFSRDFHRRELLGNILSFGALVDESSINWSLDFRASSPASAGGKACEVLISTLRSKWEGQIFWSNLRRFSFPTMKGACAILSFSFAKNGKTLRMAKVDQRVIIKNMCLWSCGFFLTSSSNSAHLTR